MFKLRRFLKNYKKELILGPFFKLLEAIFELIVPLVMADIIDTGIKNGDSVYVWKMSGLIALLGIGGLGFALTCQYFAAKCAYGFGTELRDSLYKHINSLSHAEIDRFGTSSLTTRLINDTNLAQNGVNMFIRLAVRAPFLIIGAAVMAMILDFKLSLIFLIAAPIITAVLYIIMRKTVPLYKKIQKNLDRISLLTRENLEGVRVIRAFSKQEKEKKEFNEASNELAVNSIVVGKISAILNPVTFMIMNLSIVAILWFGGIRVNIGDLSQGQITAFVNYMTQILLALVVLANLIVIFTKAASSSSRINEVFETQPSVTGGTKVKFDFGAPAVECGDLTFTYPDAGGPALKNISFSLKKGETLGIIGGTGSGKTTVVRKIIESLPTGEVVLLPQDSYYKDSSHVPVEERQNINFDHPDAFEWSLLSKHIMLLKEGKSIEQPTYSYLTCTRQPETIHIEPREVVIIEGILALCDKKLRNMMDLKIFVDADPDERLIRVIQRDVIERGRTALSLIHI